MVNRKNKTLEYRRKRTGQTNYNVRLGLLKSGVPRIVVRKTSKYLNVQLVQYVPDGDKTLVSLSSKVLQKNGWNYSCRNIPAGYLIGLMFGKLALKQSKSAIVDLGSILSKKEAVVYAIVKGAIDAGMDIPVSEEILPSEERLNGTHIKNYAENLDKDTYNKLFSGYNKLKVDAKKIPEEFEKLKKSIMK